MTQVRLAIVAGAGVLALCAIALIGSLLDYVSHPAVANVHVPPAIGTPVPGSGSQVVAAAAPAPVITTTPVDPSPAPPAPAPPSRAIAPVPGAGTPVPAAQSGDLARFLQQLRSRDHRVPRIG
ncbi:MAG TPA: hypothetical protein VGO86_03055 [Candidatus Dormibacteraeota bacterium]